MGSTLSNISAYSILIPFLLACIRFSKIRTSYLPFILFIAGGFLAEFSSELVIRAGYSNNFILNIFSLLQAYFVTWQLKNWDLFNKNKKTFPVLIIFYTIFWL